MNDQTVDSDGVEDIGAAVREGRPIRAAESYRISISDETLNFRGATITDPVPLGRQILGDSGFDPRDGYSLFAILQSGDFEDVRLDETFDLRERGVERFIAFRTDREFKLTLNDAQLEWGKPVVSGTVLYKLGSVPADQVVFLEVRGGEDRLIEPTDLIDLTASGIERFFTAPRPVPTFEIIVNSRPKNVNDPHVTFEQVVQIAFPGSHGPNIEFSMTYRHAASKPHAGELAAGGVVEVKKKGTVFNVTRTDKS
ncbi:MAG: multiubiquitin domain-containing protein [Pirellulales bacterium]